MQSRTYPHRLRHSLPSSIALQDEKEHLDVQIKTPSVYEL